MNNNELKQLVLKMHEETGILDYVSAHNNHLYKLHYNIISAKEWKNNSYYQKVVEFLNPYHEVCPEILIECDKILDSLKKRKQRLKKRLDLMLNNYDTNTFITLTFNDTCLHHTSPEERRLRVRRFLKYFGCYVGNIDFGKENHREHYHAVVSGKVTTELREVYYKLFYGSNINFQNITTSKKSAEKLAKYVAKLTNHALKETTKREALLYSRLPKE